MNPTVSGATTLVVPSVLAITIWLFCVDTIVWPAAVITGAVGVTVTTGCPLTFTAGVSGF